MVPAIGGNNMWGPRRTETKQKKQRINNKQTNKQNVEKEEAGVVQ